MDAAFKPATYLVKPADFGKVDEPEWTATVGGDEGIRYAALIQHRIVRALREKAGDRHPAEYLALLLEESSRKPYLSRKIHGRLPLTFAELTNWIVILGLDPGPTFELPGITARPAKR